MARVLEEMKLAPEKREQVRKVLRESMERTRSAPEGDREARQKIGQETREKLRNILSPEEMQRLHELMREQRGQRGDGPEGRDRDRRRPGGRGDDRGPKDGAEEEGSPPPPPPAAEESIW